MKTIIEKAGVLIEALPYLQKFRGKIFVVKYGGHAMTEESLQNSFIKDIILLKHIGIHPIIVHGGGPQIEVVLKKMGIKSHYHDGLRITDAETMEVVEMVLLGRVNYDLVARINKMGGSAVGFAGADGNLIQAKKKIVHQVVNGKKVKIDLGFVGEVTKINPQILLRTVSEDLFIPVIAPIGLSETGESLNINADEAACDIATALKAEKLILLTDVPGVKNKDGNIIAELKQKDVPNLIKNKTIHGGMIPKVQSAVRSVKEGVGSVAIVDGKVKHALLLEIFTDTGVGTLIR